MSKQLLPASFCSLDTDSRVVALKKFLKGKGEGIFSPADLLLGEFHQASFAGEEALKIAVGDAALIILRASLCGEKKEDDALIVDLCMLLEYLPTTDPSAPHALRGFASEPRFAEGRVPYGPLAKWMKRAADKTRLAAIPAVA